VTSRARDHQPAAIVTGLESIAGLQSARILSRRGVPVIGIGNDPDAPFCRTRVCERILIADGGDLVDVLRSLGPTLSARAVIVPSTDGEVVQLAANQDELSTWYHIALPPEGVVGQLMDKARFLQFALANDLPVPKTVYLDDRDDAEAAARDLRYPAAVKPAVRDARWIAHTKVKAFKVDGPDEFLAVHERASRWSDQLIAQEWIEGGEDQLFSCNAYFDRQSEPLVTFVSRKLRQWPPQTGMSALAEECRNDAVLETALRLFQTAGFHGLAYLEMKRDVRDGRHYIVEPNVGRATGRSAIAEAGGVDILLTMYRDLVGLPLPRTREQRYLGAKWIYLRWDLQAAQANIRSGDLTIADWWRSVRGPRTYAAFDLRDPVPFALDFAGIVTRRFRRPAVDAPRADAAAVGARKRGTESGR
jgi:D-aspartate ligase